MVIYQCSVVTLFLDKRTELKNQFLVISEEGFQLSILHGAIGN